MQHPDDTNPEQVKPDLKHDTMEYSAATEGEDVLDTDTESALEVDDESISAEELELLEEDSADDQAAALVTAETDSAADEDNFFAETDEATEANYPDEITEDPENERAS